MMQFLSDQGTVVIGSPSPHKIILNLTPDQWEVPIRVEEASIQNKHAKRNEALIYGSDDESESDDE